MLRRVATVLAAVATLTAAADAAAELSIEDAVSLALSRNERAEQASLRVDAAAAGVVKARAGLLPTVSVGANVSMSAVPSRDGGRWSSAATATLTQPLIAPSVWPAYAQSKHLLDAERFGAVEDRRRLAYEVAHSFLQALANEQALRASESRRRRAEGNLTTADVRAQAQLASTNDVTRATLDVATAARDVAKQQGSVQAGYLSLGQLLDIVVRGPLVPPHGATGASALVGRGVDALVQDALAQRPDIRETIAKVQAQEDSLREPYYRLAPTLYLVAQGRAVPDPPVGASSLDATVSLNLSWTIFDGGARYGDIAQRRALSESAKLDQRLLQRSVDQEIRSALIAFETARAALALANETVVAAQRNTVETQVLYTQGLARASELTDANSSEYEAELGVVSAELTLEQAGVDLRYVLGLEPVASPGRRGAP